MSTQAMREALRALADKNLGVLTPEEVVEAARPKDSPLHSWFTWDNRAAAEKCRIDEARTLIRTVRVEVTNTFYSVDAPAFVRDPQKAPEEQGYVSIGRLRNNAEAARDAVIAEFSRASAALARAKNLALALGLGDQIEAVRSHIAQLEQQVSASAAAA